MCDLPDGADEALSTVVRYRCPIADCRLNVIRIDKHLKSVHGLKSKTEEYLNALATSERVEVQPLVSKPDNPVLENSSLAQTSFTPITPFELDKHTSAAAAKVTSTLPLQLSGNRIVQPCQIDIEATREQFRMWLSTLAGGSREKHATNQHIYQVFTILYNSSQLFLPCAKTYFPCEHVVIISKTFLKAVEKTRIARSGLVRAPGSLSSFLSSFALYVDFLKQEFSDALRRGALAETASSIKVVLKRLQKLKSRRRLEVQAKEKKELITKEDTRHFLNSTSRKQTLMWLRDPEAKISLKKAAQIRNLIMSEILMQCPQRSGALAGMTLEDLRSATRHANTSGKVTFVISVQHHKTAHCYGAAEFPVTDILYRDICTYAQRIRPGDQKSVGSHLFVTRNSKPLLAADVSSGINSAWQLSECRQRRITATLARKSVGQACLEKRPGLIEAVAALMSHSVRTHHQYYQMAPGHAHVAAVGQSIRKLMGVDEGPSLTLPEFEESEGEFLPENYPDPTCSLAVDDEHSETGINLSRASLPSPTDTLLQPTSKTDLTRDDFPIDALFLPIADDEWPQNHLHGRHKLSSEERQILKGAFARYSGGKVSTNQIRQVASFCEDVGNMVKKHGLKTVYESIRSERRNTKA